MTMQEYKQLAVKFICCKKQCPLLKSILEEYENDNDKRYKEFVEFYCKLASALV